MFEFKLTDEQLEKLFVWFKEQEEKDAKRQNRDKPYYGCIGGVYTYCFSPNSIGVCVKVINEFSKEEINLTEYDNW